MKAINSSVRGRSCYGDLCSAKHVGHTAPAIEKKVTRRTERARLKMMLIGELHQEAAIEAKQHQIELGLKRDRLYRKLIDKVSHNSGTTRFGDWAAEQGLPVYQPVDSRHNLWADTATGRKMIASCG